MKKREKFLRKLNEAFASCDTGFIAKSVTDDIKWIIVGEKVIRGREEFEDALDRMKEGGPMQIEVLEIILENGKAVVEGIVETKIEPGKILRYAFCDIYEFSETNKDQVSQLRTYVSKLKNK